MPRRQNASLGATPVEAIQHADKRVNLPTADAQDFIDPEVEEIKHLRWDRDPSLDPQLVWRGKDDVAEELLADAPPIYIQEKIDPRVLVENLRQTAAEGQEEPEATLFDTFDGLDELDLVDFYRHPANWSNRMVLGDSLPVMASLAERESMRGKVQMVYIDPPYGIKFGSNWQVSTRRRDVKDGKLEDVAREAEQIKAFRDTWELGIGSYLSYLRDRLVVVRDLLTESGSVFVQIGDENVHLVRSLLDEVFGSENFVSLITFTTTGTTTGRYLSGTASYIVWYARDLDSLKFRQLYQDKALGGAGAAKYDQVDGAGRPYRLDNLTSPRIRAGRTGFYPVTVDGRTFTPLSGEWKTHPQGMARLVAAGRVRPTRNSLAYVRYLDDFPAFPLNDVWPDVGGIQSRADPKIYVVQTSTTIISRCMLMCTDPGDLVLDPTCGSGATAYVAEQWGRRWITIDTSRVALALARQRLMGARFPYYILADSESGRRKLAELTATATATAQGIEGNDTRQGFVYERVPHVTLKSIANNPDIQEGMGRSEIDAAIARYADVELLYDKPYEDKKTVRVSGPFTVESLSPHRSLSFSSQAAGESGGETRSEQNAALDAGATTFEQTILDNLVRAGVQNGRRAERIEFASLQAYAGAYIQAVGERRENEADDVEGASPFRVAVAVGPQYGTVSPAFIKAAAREAINMEDVDLLCVLGFAFDPTALNATEADGVTVEASEEGFANVAGVRRMGRIPVLFVRMNADLLMGEDLKKTGAGNLFTVFGEPDIEVRSTDDGRLVVELLGVDVYDPTTGQVRSGGTNQVALWMVDTKYNEESFFVRHCYFTGGNDPLKRLKGALKSEIDVDAWASLYDTVSRAFDKPETGKIAVKVINDYGDEVMKVFTL
ncbi:site-specific DNA-methyltransferase [Geodermatophilus sp. URMC 60]